MTEGQDRVEDGEELYRRVRDQTPAGQLCFQNIAGRVVFSQAAFNDPQKRPSVDRAKLSGNNPHHARVSRDDGIVALQADAIRQIALNRHGQAQTMHSVNVIPNPVEGNPAHAVIVTDPAATSGIFKRLKEALARLATEAGWRVEPGVPILRPKFLAILHDAFRWVIEFFRRVK